MATDTLQMESTPATARRAAWDVAVREYKAAHAQFDANWAAYEAADAELKKSQPYKRKAELELAYGIRPHMDRSELLDHLDKELELRAFPNGTPDDLSEEKIDAMADEATAILNEYVGVIDALKILREKVSDAARDEHNRFTHEVFYPAREKLFATPAPDPVAIVLKAEVLAATVDEAEGLRDDLKRLLYRAE